ncbi:MAG: peptide chain release factor 1 [Lentisphaeraceae bacterium]|nr:peptide chain release factor 1 [Lentisphaeraceae bacterium]
MIDFSSKMEQMRVRFKQLENEMANPAVFEDRQRYTEISKEHQRITTLIECYDNMQNAIEELDENKEMLAAESDPEFCDVIKADIKELEENVPVFEQKLKQLIVPPAANDSRNSIIEIRPAAGGDEAALFADELFRMYEIYAQTKNWKVEVINHTASDLGGLRHVAFLVKGDDVYRELRFESGVHRVQRVPSTESQGRVHTSTVTVAVLPEAEEVDIELKSVDLRIDVYRSSGAGGHCVNTTDSAVRITHIPTGIFFASQQERSQHKNKEIAMKLLRSKLLEEKEKEEQAKMASERKSQVGSGDRSERIRTYNFPQNRVTDHRYGITRYDLTDVMSGQIGNVLNEILTMEADQKLAAELGQ